MWITMAAAGGEGGGLVSLKPVEWMHLGPLVPISLKAVNCI